MMAPRPEHRPQSVAELREVLVGRNAVPIVTAPAPLMEESRTSWEHTVVRDPAADPAMPAGMAALLAMRAEASDSDLRRRFGNNEPPSERWRREARRRERRRRVVGLSVLLMLVAAGAAVWQFGPIDLQQLISQATGPARPAAAPASPTPVAQAAPVAATSAAEPASAAVAALASTAAVEVIETAPSAAQVRALDAHVPTRGEPENRPAERTPRSVKAEPVPPPPTAQDAPAADAPGNPALASAGPAERCRGRVMLAWYRCVKRACQAAPQFADAHECQRVRQIEIENARPRTMPP
jgi:hypothetical protein